MLMQALKAKKRLFDSEISADNAVVWEAHHWKAEGRFSWLDQLSMNEKYELNLFIGFLKLESDA